MTRIGYQLSSLKPRLTTAAEVWEALARLKAMGYAALQIDRKSVV